MTTLAFVTPAWGRYDIVAVCLEQRRRVIEELRLRGIDAYQVVIADDENLDIARSLGAHTVEMENIVARKFNAGMKYAGDMGTDWIVPIGSDSWIDYRYFHDMDPHYTGRTLTSPAYCAVTPTTLARLWVSPNRLHHSAGPYVFHRSLLAPAGFTPAADDSNMVDTSTISGIERHGVHIRWQVRTAHAFQYVGFRVPPMMTTFASLWKAWGVREYEPWSTLGAYYPPDLVARARKVMEAYA